MRNQKEIVVFMGPEGAGKSTISLKLAEELRMPRVYTGELITYYREKDTTYLGDAARLAYANGRYLEGKYLLDIVKARFQKGDLGNGFIFDGAMRTLDETVGYPQVFEEVGFRMPVTVVSLRLPRWESMERLVTGPAARKRQDDTVERVIERLTDFQLNLPQRKQAMQQQGWNFVQVSAFSPLEVVLSNVKRALHQETGN